MAEPTQTLQYFGKTISSLCATLPTPIILTGLFRDVLCRHFIQADNIQDPQLQGLVWTNNDQTGILIESIHRWLPATTGKRPAIIIKRNAYRNSRATIGDRYQGTPGDQEGNYRYTTHWAGSHTLFCLGRSGAQAELLSTEVQRELTQFAPELLSLPYLHRLQVVEVGEISEVEEAHEHFAVPVTVLYQYEQNWKIRLQAPRLMQVSTELIHQC